MMKRILCSILLFGIAFFLISCSSRRSTQPPKGGQSGTEEQGGTTGQGGQNEKPDKNEGKKVVEGYLQALILRDTNKIKSFYSSGLKQSCGNFTPSTEPHPVGYKLDNLDEKEGKLEGKAKIFSVIDNVPYFSADESSITVVKEKGSYLIDKIEKSKSTEVIEKDKALFMKQGEDIKGREIVKLDDLPRFAAPQGSTPDIKYSIGRDNFGPIALDPDGKVLALSTVGTYPSLMTMDEEGKKFKSLDLYTEGKVRSLIWSSDGKSIAALMSGRGGNFLNIYDIEKGKRIDDPMRSAFKSDVYSIQNPYWISEGALVFNVMGVSKLTPDQQKQVGSYKFDIKNNSLTKY